MPSQMGHHHVRFLHRLQSSAIETHGRTTGRRQEQLVCRKRWLRKNSRGAWARNCLFSSTQTASADQLSVHRYERQSGNQTVCFSVPLTCSRPKRSQIIFHCSFPSNFSTSKREITVGISHVFPLARSCHTVPSLSASSEL